MARTGPLPKFASTNNPAKDSKAVIAESRSNELFFAVVGPVGAGGSQAMKALARVCEAKKYSVQAIKGSKLIREWAGGQGQPVPNEKASLEIVTELQNLGDQMRERGVAEVAKAAMREIAKRRAEATGQDYVPGETVVPDSQPRVYLIDSIRHPAEIHLLRRTYGNAFGLIGVVCEEGERKRRILSKYFLFAEHGKPETIDAVNDFMNRDSDDSEKKHGQHVTEAFFEADFFLDNSQDDPGGSGQLLDTELERFVNIVAHHRVERPTIEETAMHHAHSARVRSACLSRQVGAALVDAGGTVVATGTNEVPAAGGGVYGERFAVNAKASEDHRCAFRSEQFCSSNREQNQIINELIEQIPELNKILDRGKLTEQIRKTRLGGLIEFSRAVHAEMDALLSAGRDGVSTIGTRLFVTTYPCHYCARHIVSAGVHEVQYIEPYPKSLAIKLHKDAIEVNPAAWSTPSIGADASPEADAAKSSGPAGMKSAQGQAHRSNKVLFRPFVGIAPRMYARAFEKTWQLKNKITGNFEMNPPEWGSEWSTLTVAYPQLEAILAK